MLMIITVCPLCSLIGALSPSSSLLHWVSTPSPPGPSVSPVNPSVWEGHPPPDKVFALSTHSLIVASRSEFPPAQSQAKFTHRGACTKPVFVTLVHASMHAEMQKCIQAGINKCREYTHACIHQHVSDAECPSQPGSLCSCVLLNLAAEEWFEMRSFGMPLPGGVYIRVT